MGSSRKAEKTAETVEGTTIPETDVEVPEWVTNALNETAVAVYQQAAPSQFRRALDEHELMAWITKHVKESAEDEAATGLDIFRRIASAATLDDVLAGGEEATTLASLDGVILECHSIKFRLSDKANGCPFYAVADVRRTDTGKREQAILGGWMVVAQLAQMHYRAAELPVGSPFVLAEEDNGAMPRDSYPYYFKVKTRTLANGNTMNSLVSPMD